MLSEQELNELRKSMECKARLVIGVINELPSPLLGESIIVYLN